MQKTVRGRKMQAGFPFTSPQYAKFNKVKIFSQYGTTYVFHQDILSDGQIIGE